MSRQIRSTRFDRETLIVCMIVIVGMVLAVASTWSSAAEPAHGATQNREIAAPKDN